MLPVPRRRVIEWLTVAAAILIAVVLGLRFSPGIVGERQPDLFAQEIVASHLRSLQPGHLVDVQSTDQHTLKPWFDGKLDFSPTVRDLSTDGFPLIGGRLDYVGNRDVAALVYQRRKHVINVYVWPANGSGGGMAGSPEEKQFPNGYDLVSWQRGGMQFCAVSDVNAGDLRQLVQLLEQ